MMTGHKKKQKLVQDAPPAPLTDEEKRELVEVLKSEETKRKKRLDELQDEIDGAQVAFDEARTREEDTTRKRDFFAKEKQTTEVEKARFNETERDTKREVDNLRADFEDKQRIAKGDDPRRQKLLTEAKQEQTDATEQKKEADENIRTYEQKKSDVEDKLASKKGLLKEAGEKFCELKPRVTDLEKKRDDARQKLTKAKDEFANAKATMDFSKTALADAETLKLQTDEEVEGIQNKVSSYRTELKNLKHQPKSGKEQRITQLKGLKKTNKVNLKAKEDEQSRYAKDVLSARKAFDKAEPRYRVIEDELAAARGICEAITEEFKTIEMELKDADYKERMYKNNCDMATKEINDYSNKINEGGNTSRTALECIMAAVESLERLSDDNAQSDMAEAKRLLDKAEEREKEIRVQIKMADQRIAEVDQQVGVIDKQLSNAKEDITREELRLKEAQKEHKALDSELDRETKRCNKIHMALFMQMCSNVTDERMRVMKHGLSTSEKLSPAKVARLHHMDELWEALDESKRIGKGSYACLTDVLMAMSDGQSLIVNISEAEESILRPYKIEQNCAGEERISIEADGMTASHTAKENLWTSGDYCIDLLRALYKPINDKLSQDSYSGPRGYYDYSSEMQLLKKKYHQSGELGDQKHEAFDDFLLEISNDSDQLLQNQLEQANELKSQKSEINSLINRVEEWKSKYENKKIENETSIFALKRDLEEGKHKYTTAEANHSNEISRKEASIRELNEQIDTKEQDLKQNAEQREGELRRQIAVEREKREDSERVAKCLLLRIEDFNKDKERMEKKHCAEIETLTCKKNEVRIEWVNKLAEHGERHKKELVKVEEECEARVESAEKKKDANISELNEQIKRFQKQSDARMKDVTEMRRVYQEQVETEKNRSQTAREDENVRELERIEMEAVEKTRKAMMHEEEVQHLKGVIESLNERLTSVEIDKSKLKKELRQTSESNADDISKLRRVHVIEVAKLGREKEYLDEDLQKSKKDHDQRISQLVQQYAESAEQQRARYEDDSKRLKAIIANLEAEQKEYFEEKIQQFDKAANELHEKTKASLESQRHDFDEEMKQSISRRNTQTRSQELNEMRLRIRKELDLKYKTEYGEKIKGFEAIVENLEASLKAKDEVHVADVARIEARHEVSRKRKGELHERVLKDRDDRALRDLEDGARRHRAAEKLLEDRMERMQQRSEELNREYQDRDDKCRMEHKNELDKLKRKFRIELEEQKEAARNHLRETTECLQSRLQVVECQLKDVEVRFEKKDDYCSLLMLSVRRCKLGNGTNVNLEDQNGHPENNE